LLKFGGFLLTGLAPGCPEIDHKDFAAQVSKLDFAFSIQFIAAKQGQCKVVDHLPGLNRALLGALKAKCDDGKQPN
jgi:hypothetical protein